MTAVLLALVGAYGVHLLYTALVQGWRGIGPGPTRGPVDADGTPVPVASRSAVWRARLGERMTQAGLDQVRPTEFAGVMAGLFLVARARIGAMEL